MDNRERETRIWLPWGLRRQGDLGSVPRSRRSLEEGMAAHSIILAWRIPWTEEPRGLQSTGSQSQTRLSDLHLCSLCSVIESLLSIE